jgi:pimeloyl-ACP methyl ester carboxylesterase
VVLFDKRDTGLSDRAPGAATLEERIDDVRAVMRAAGSERAVLFGYSEGARGSHQLTGAAGRWPLFAVSPPEPR